MVSGAQWKVSAYLQGVLPSVSAQAIQPLTSLQSGCRNRLTNGEARGPESPRDWPEATQPIGSCCGQNVCVLPSGSPPPQCDGVWRGGLWEAFRVRWGHGGGPPGWD